MSNPYYNYTSGQPVTLSRNASAEIRNEFSGVGSGFEDLNTALPSLIADAVAVGGLATNCTSTTSNTIGLGNFTFTVEGGKPFVVGMTIKFAITSSPTNYIIGTITSYNSTTGVMGITVASYGEFGSGTSSAWTGSLTYPPQPVQLQSTVPTGEVVASGNLLAIDDSGNSLAVDSITTGIVQAVTATSLHACALSNGNTAIFWTAGSTDLRMMVVDSAGATVLASTSVGTGLSNTQIWATQLTNGNIVFCYKAITTQYPTFKIIDTSGVQVVAATTIESAAPSSDTKVCALTGGGFATVHCGSSVSKYAVYTNTGAVTSALATMIGSAHNVVSICPMANGGFAAFSGTSSSMTGNRYGSTGILAGGIGVTINTQNAVIGTASTTGSIVAASGGNLSPFSPSIHLASDSSTSPLNTIDNTVQNSGLAVSFDVAINFNTKLSASSVTVLGDGSYLAIYTAYTTSEEYPRFVNFWGDGTVIRSGYIFNESTYSSSGYAMYAMPVGQNGFSLVWAASNRNIKFAHVKSGKVIGISAGQNGANTLYDATGVATVTGGNMLNVGGQKVNYSRQGLKVVI